MDSYHFHLSQINHSYAFDTNPSCFLHFYPPLGAAKKRRGRPRSNLPKKDTKSYNIEDILKGTSYPLELVTTKVGGMKAAFRDYCFEFHFNRNGNKFWRCLSHANGCPAKIMSKGSLLYVIELNHNHESDPIVFVNTVELVSTKTIPGPSHVEPEIIAATIKQPAVPPKQSTDDANRNASLRDQMKKRFAMLNQKSLQKWNVQTILGFSSIGSLAPLIFYFVFSTACLRGFYHYYSLPIFTINGPKQKHNFCWMPMVFFFKTSHVQTVYLYYF